MKTMRYVKTDELKAGNVLAKDITDIKGNILLKANNTILSEYIISKLKERKINGIYVEDEISKDVQIDESIPARTLSYGLSILQV